MGECIVFFENGDSYMTIRNLSREEAKEKVEIFKNDGMKAYFRDIEREVEKEKKKKKKQKLKIELLKGE